MSLNVNYYFLLWLMIIVYTNIQTLTFLRDAVTLNDIQITISWFSSFCQHNYKLIGQSCISSKLQVNCLLYFRDINDFILKFSKPSRGGKQIAMCFSRHPTSCRVPPDPSGLEGLLQRGWKFTCVWLLHCFVVVNDFHLIWNFQ